MRTPEFLNVEDVIDLHDALLDEHGGQSGIRDSGLLESAVAMPAATFDGAFLHEDLFHMASASRAGPGPLLNMASDAEVSKMIEVALSAVAQRRRSAPRLSRRARERRIGRIRMLP